jgi:hypothetical protein
LNLDRDRPPQGHLELQVDRVVGHRTPLVDHIPPAGQVLVVVGDRRSQAANRIRVAAGGDLDSLGVVAQAGRESGCGWDHNSDHIVPGVELHSHVAAGAAAGTNRGAEVGMRPIQESVIARCRMRQSHEDVLTCP